MDGDSVSSHQDQISLYGLFGDSSTTLQGLNDHLCSSLMQQSPPCGTSFATPNAIAKAVIKSPPKLQAQTNGVQHGGVLLSDLADRSPSAGSITAASLCNFVSYGNQRCTNLVTYKGKRYCNQHSGESVSLVKKAIFKKPPSSMNLKQIDGFLPISKSDLINGNIRQNFMPSSCNTSILAAVSKVRTTPSHSGVVKQNGIDVSDNAKYADHSNSSTQNSEQPVSVMKKVGKTITVCTRPMTLNRNDNTPPRMVSSTAASNVINLANARSPMKSFVTTSNKASTPSYSVPFYKKLEPVTVLSQGKEPKNKRLQSNSAVASNVAGQHASTFAVNKPSGTDETLFKKLMEVLNGKDLTMEEQLSALQSLGVTIVQGPLAAASDSSKKKRSGIERPTAVNIPAESSSSHFGLPAGNVNHPATSLNEKLDSNNRIRLQQVAGAENVPGTLKKVKKNSSSSKPAQKRKQKPADDSSSKRGKFDGKSTDDGTNKRRLKTPTDKTKHKKNAVQTRLSILSANPPAKLMTVSPSAPSPFKALSRYMNEKSALETDLFADRVVEVEKNLPRADKGKALKQRLLKKHVSKKHVKPDKVKINYKQCLEDLDSADPWKTFAAAKSLLGLLTETKPTPKGVHHERIIDKLCMSSEDAVTGCNLDADDISTTSASDRKAAFTLDTLLMKDKYSTLSEEINREEYELRMLSECFNENATLTMQTVNSYLGGKSAAGVLKKSTALLLCQLSSEEGLKCCKKSLPYADYCKEHIWHCETQCLYKLGHDMKTVADVSPEPTVKRAKKRAKLLPLIKKYKKKKRKKVEQQDESKGASQTLDASNTQVNYQDRKSNHIAMQQSSNCSDNNSSISKTAGTRLNLEIDDAKRSDSSDDDLNLMTNEIMLSGVLDKLQDDAQEFDLFSEKNAEELERALLLAAASPTPDDQPEQAPLGNGPRDSKPNLNSELLPSPMMNGSPDAIVNCDAPKSDEDPPSLDGFDRSQIAHYTFGSAVARSVKKECAGQGFVSTDAVPPLISAEDLQDLEGVLERLDAEAANSPKLPSSPAVDQYTSMLARQLSQEVESESLMLESVSSVVATSSGPSRKSRTGTVSTSFALTAPSSLAPASPSLTRTISGMSFSGMVPTNVVPRSPSGQFCELGTAINVIPPPASSPVQVKNNAQLQKTSSASLRNNVTHKTVNVLPTGMQGQAVTSGAVTAASLVHKVKATKSSAPANLHLPGGGVSRAVAKTQQIPKNHAVPFGIMQSQQSQSGNVIKVIVPPGAIINGANGQQNMLLIPVSALMKTNLQSAGQNVLTGPGQVGPAHGSIVNVKPQLNNLPSGQQFIIVNNGNASMGQTHLTLVQKPGAVNAQQGIVLKQQGANLKDANAYARRRLSQDQASQISSLNATPNMQMKQGSVRLDQGRKVSTYAVSAAAPMIVSYANATTAPPSQVTKVVAAKAGKMTAARNQGGRRKGKNTPRKPKARFDPITRKYVPVTDAVALTTVEAVPIAVPPPPTIANRKESLIKFNESRLSIQSKVQQIDSVLSSLNAAASKVQQDQAKVRAGKAVTSAVNSCVQAKATYVKASDLSCKTQKSKPQAPANNAVTLMQVRKMTANISDLKSRMKTVSAPVSGGAVSTSTSSVTNPALNTGTVHWNRTTTAGPGVSSNGVTVPVYITGAIPANSWGGELTLGKSSIGAALPVILPARKTNAISSRLVVSNVVTPALAKMSTAGPGAMLKRSLISMPHGLVTVPKTKMTTAAVPKTVEKLIPARSNHTVRIALGKTASQNTEVSRVLTTVSDVVSGLTGPVLSSTVGVNTLSAAVTSVSKSDAPGR